MGSDRSVNEAHGESRGEDPARRVFAEFLGTAALTFVAAGVAAVNGALGHVPPAWQGLAPGLLIMAMIYSLGAVSGAHFNPGVTLAFAARGDFPWRRVPSYWVAQFVGGIVAAAILRVMFGTAAHVGATVPHVGAGAALVTEVILTFLLLTVILATATDHRVVGPNAAIAVGFTIALDGILGVPVTGASMNPARSLGPALFGGTLDSFWIYGVASLIAVALAVAAAWMLRGRTTSEARRTATGRQ